MQANETSSFERRRGALVDLGLLATREDSVERLFDEAAVFVRNGLGADASKILERRPSGSLLVRAGSGWSPGVVGEIEIPSDGDSQANYALRSGEPVIVTDLRAENRFTPWPAFLELGVISGVNVVIEGKHGPYGVLEVDHYSTRTFSKDDISFLQSAANLLSVALDRQQYEQERNHFMDVTAHELRNPLSVVIGRSQRLMRQLQVGAIPREDLLRGLDDIIGEGSRVQRLLGMLLQLGRAERATDVARAPVDLMEMTSLAIEYAQQEHADVRFTTMWPEHEVTVEADEDLARIILGNLVENAAKYSVLTPEVTVTITDSSSHTEVRILDRCGGIEGEALDRLFDRYFRGHTAQEFRGFGLGLFVSHRAAEMLDWRIDVQNYPGEGCEFVISIAR